jgi:N-acetylneuraminate synthase/N,N'-diacetyllegionaminate synthase
MSHNHTIIIAEAGVNHNGDLHMAMQLIDSAVNAGVDYIKFQSFVADKLVSPKAKKAEYQIVNIKDGDDSQYSMLKKLELSNQDHLELISYCKKNNAQFLSTAFDVDGVNYLNDLALPLFKIPSGEITNFPYLRAIALCRKPVIMSTGMCTENEIEQAIKVLLKFGLLKEQISILHCNTEYPTPMKDVNLKAMLTIKEKFKVSVGYSDHTLGIEVPIAAVALGATIIEKHFTLDRSLPGPDHVASLEPNELKAMVKAIRNIELSISGDGMKVPSESESKNISIARKSIHLQKDLPKGHIISDEDLIALRPGDGISPMKWESILGRRLSVEKNKFDKLTISDLI